MLTAESSPLVIRSHRTGGSETVRLWGWESDWSVAAAHVTALLFGEMVQRALPVVDRYHSDLYHDALLLADPEGPLGAEPKPFPWMVRECGTNFGESALVQEQISHGENRVLYLVTVFQENGGLWSVRFDELVAVREL